jgi:transposase
MRIRIRLTDSSRQAVAARLHSAYQGNQLRLVKRIHALFAIVAGESVAEVAELLHLGEQTVRDYVCAFIRNGVDSLSYQRPSGRPPKLTKTQRKELADWITAGPEAAGYTSACWSTPVICDLILTRFGVEYHPHYVCELLAELGFSFQKARFVSDHLDEAARQQWLTETWPEIRRVAQAQKAMILFGDEASCAQWGSLSYTWAPKGQQPTVKTSGKRKGYKVFGLIDFCSGRLFWQGQTERFNAESYMAFLEEVLTQTEQHLLLIQDGARYHTSKAMQDFFAAHADRLTKYQLPAYSPDFNPIEYLWRNVKKDATHLKCFADFAELKQKVDKTLQQLATLPDAILGLMGRYCESLGTAA